MSFLVKACTEFSAAHSIKGHPRCGRVHGHNYRVCVWLREDEPMGIDLDDLEKWLRVNVFERFDHRYLNELLGRETVTSEDLAVIVARGLAESFGDRVERVEVCETRDLCVEYSPR
ncbi:6-carboxytetrahydropterin synthase QueD [Pyrofollis japonicus]|uniref:6-pyruvoyl trahydropterin synthase family protein n=1 Tax=Pyrofollis japonicus TaxID=3060460 RepID=UPI00295BC2DC|nr:6-carboxytetrahydropterin synthase [Pyrofollis japonicus]BEP17292.1 6-carboxytetrahydropterin synthase QueD [Pyrofollis japonicus]